MTLEKPISTIRKAVQVSAERAAFNENIYQPQQKHYDKVFKTYKLLKKFSPQLFEKCILLSAGAKELKDEVGKELYDIFFKAWVEITKRYAFELNSYIDKINATKKLSLEEKIKEMENFSREYFKEKNKILKKNPQVLSAFLGRYDLLNKCIDYSIDLTIDLQESWEKYTAIKK